MKKFSITKTLRSVHWKSYAVPDAFSCLEMEVFGREVILLVTEGYTSERSNRIVEHVAWHYLKPEDLEALANAALCMADDLRNLESGGAS